MLDSYTARDGNHHYWHCNDQALAEHLIAKSCAAQTRHLLISCGNLGCWLGMPTVSMAIMT